MKPTGKARMKSLVLFVLGFLACARVFAVTVSVDPADAFAGSWAEEWNSAGLDGWTTTQTSGTVQMSGTNGVFTGVTTGTNASVQLSAFSSGPDLDLGYNNCIQIRAQVPASYAGAIQIFYGTTSYLVNDSSGAAVTASTTGFSSARALTIPASLIPKDGAFHIYRLGNLGLEVYWRATLRDLQIAPVTGPGSSGMTWAIDYIRIGDQPGAAVYLPRYSPVAPTAGGTNAMGNVVSSMESRHFRFLWDSTSAASAFWTSTMPHNTLRNLEEVWQTHVNMLGYGEPTQAIAPADRDGNKYKVNVTTWYSGYWAGADYPSTNTTGTFAYLNITPDGLRGDPPTWVPPHEFAHVLQFHNTSGYFPAEWNETHANYCRERWLEHYQAFFPNQSGIDPTFLRCANQIIGEGRDEYLCWPFFLYVDQNPDGLPGLGEGTMVKILRQTQAGEYSMMTLNRLASATGLQDIVGYFARRGLTYNYAARTAIQTSLAGFGVPLDNAATARWQLTDLVQRSDDPAWWRVPFEMAPMQGAYALHQLAVSGSGTPGRVVTVNFHGLPDSARGADWRACFIVVADNGAERYSGLWNSGTNSVTLSGSENQLYLSVAGAPAVFYKGGQDNSLYPYRSDPSMTRFPYEIHVTGATPAQRANGPAPGLVQHPNGGGYVASTATVASTAYVGPNALVLGNATVSGNASIQDYAVVQDTAQVSGSAIISGHAWVRVDPGAATVITGNAKVRDWALVEGGVVSGFARILEHANIKGGVVTDTATAKGCSASLSGTLNGNAIIDGNYGDYFSGRNISNGIAFGMLPYVGIPDGWITPLPSGLYASYTFDTAHDSRILDQYCVTDGFTIGSPAWIAADAVRKGFLQFDGVSQAVALDRSVADLHNFTFAAWVKPLGGAPNQAVLWLGASATQRLCLTPDDGAGHAKFSIMNGGTDETIVSTSALPPGLWTHVAVTLDGTTGALYLNGTASASSAVDIVPEQLLAPNTATGLQQNYLGRSGSNAMPMFRGALDNVQFYGKALASSDIAALLPPSAPLSSGTLYVDLRASDASAGANTWINHGTLGNFTKSGSPTLVSNVLGTGFPGVSFDGASAAYIGPSTVAALTGSSPRSIEVWAFNPSVQDEAGMVSWGYRGVQDRNISFNFGSDPIWGAATHWGDDVGWGGTYPSAGVWHHLVYTYNGSQAVSIYRDGLLTKAATLSGTLDTFASQPVNIACERETGGALSHFFAGYINTVRVHGGVLTAQQVAGNCQFGPYGGVTATPALSQIPTQTVGYGASVIPVALTVSDTGTPVGSLTLTGLAENSAFVPPANIVFSGAGATRTAFLAPTAGVTGTTAITFTVSNGAATASQTFNLVVRNQAQTWRRQYFGTTENTGAAADTANPSGNGIPNLLERAFAGNPWISGVSILPFVTNDRPNFGITYRKADAAGDLAFAIQESQDLSNWITSAGANSLLSDDGIVQTVHFTTPPGTTGKKFLRVQVTSP